MSKAGTAKDEIPKILALRAFYRALEDSVFDYANITRMEIRAQYLGKYSVTLPEVEQTERSELIHGGLGEPLLDRGLAVGKKSLRPRRRRSLEIALVWSKGSGS